MAEQYVDSLETEYNLRTKRSFSFYGRLRSRFIGDEYVICNMAFQQMIDHFDSFCMDNEIHFELDLICKTTEEMVTVADIAKMVLRRGFGCFLEKGYLLALARLYVKYWNKVEPIDFAIDFTDFVNGCRKRRFLLMPDHSTVKYRKIEEWLAIEGVAVFEKEMDEYYSKNDRKVTPLRKWMKNKQQK